MDYIDYLMMYKKVEPKEFRAVAIKAYLRAGYKPILYTPEMEGRWTAFLNEHSYSGIEAVDEDGNFIKVLNLSV